MTTRTGSDVIMVQNAGSMNVGIGFPFDVCFAGNQIGGNVIADDNSGVISINNNTIDQGVHVDENTGVEVITTNVIAHTLECDGNVPPPVSAGNVAHNYVGQCPA